MDTQATLQQFAIPFRSLDITRECVARGMGYADGTFPESFAEVVDGLLGEVEEHARIEGGFRVFPAESVRIESDGFWIKDAHFATDKVVAAPLKQAEAVALFTVTAGFGFTEWMHEHMDADKQLEAYFVDALGSETVELGADWIEKQVVQWAEAQGWRTTNRYSPGYCNWSVAEQHQLFSLLPENFCGITLTESALMQPTKSVSGVIGIGRDVEKGPYSCDVCTMENCLRRNLHR